MSKLFKLNLKDFGKGLVVAVIAALLGALQQALETQGLNLASFDWAEILNVVEAAFLAYITKNLLSDSEGKVLGKI